jgi:hypothetical protein
VVPFRFGTIYLDPEKAASALALHRAELRQALDRIRDASEWGVKLYVDHDALRRWVESRSAAVRELSDTLGRASPGARFFLQKKYDRTVGGETAATIAGTLERVGRSLDGSAGESAQIEVQAAAVHGRSAEMVMNAAYLVAERSLEPFRRTIAALQEEFSACGFHLELTGPWPPYHFVSASQKGIGGGPASDQ